MSFAIGSSSLKRQSALVLRRLPAIVIFIVALYWIPGASAQAIPDEQACINGNITEQLMQGWCLTIRRDKGNCIACHTVNIATWPKSLPLAGNIAPPLVAMTARFPDRSVLQKQIEDASTANPNSVMPPYLKHGILDRQEIKLIIKFLQSI